MKKKRDFLRSVTTALVKKSDILLLVATALVLGLGLLLPSIVARLQDRGTSRLTEQYPVETIQLDTVAPAQLLDVLTLMASPHSVVNLEEGNVLTSQQVQEATMDTLEYIGRYLEGLNLERFTLYTKNPVLIFSEDGERAAVLWRCELLDLQSDGHITLYLDDETGKMVSFLYNDANNAIAQSTVVAPREIATQWTEFCVDYYGLESSLIQYERELSVGSHYGVGADFQLRFADFDSNYLFLPFGLQNIYESHWAEEYLEDSNGNLTETSVRISRAIITFN